MNFFTAFVIGATSSLGVGLLFSSGKINAQGLAGIVGAGLLTACKDYRSLNRVPPVPSNGGTQPPFKTDKP